MLIFKFPREKVNEYKISGWPNRQNQGLWESYKLWENKTKLIKSLATLDYRLPEELICSKWQSVSYC